MKKALFIIKNLEKIIDRASSIAFKAGYIACSNEHPYTATKPPYRDVVAYTKEDFIQEAIDELKELQKINTCIGCKWEGKSAALYPCMNCIRSVDTDHYEQKEKRCTTINTGK